MNDGLRVAGTAYYPLPDATEHLNEVWVTSDDGQYWISDGTDWVWSDIKGEGGATGPTGPAAGASPQTITSSGTPSFDISTYDGFELALAHAVSSFGVTGTPSYPKRIVGRIKDDGTARALAFSSAWRFIGVTAPTTTVLGKYLLIGGIWNVADSKIDVVAIARET